MTKTQLWFEKLRVTIITYIPFEKLGLCAAIAIALFSLCFVLHLLFSRLTKKTHKFDFMRFLSLSLVIAFIYFIFDVTILSRLSVQGINYGLNMQLFTPNPEGMFSTVITALYNALMFLPISLLLPRVARPFKYVALPLCILLGCGIEYLQYYLKVGMCELDDAIYYALGALAGFLLSPLVFKLEQKFKGRKKSQ